MEQKQVAHVAQYKKDKVAELSALMEKYPIVAVGLPPSRGAAN